MLVCLNAFCNQNTCLTYSIPSSNKLILWCLVPGPVQQLRISENGPTHVKLTWRRPLEPNGRLVKYMIGFKLCKYFSL